MSPLARNLALFGTACVITGSVRWMKRDHDPSQPPPENRPLALSPAPWTKLRTMDLIQQLESASTNSDRMAAAARLSEIPESKLAEALELTTLVKDRQLTFAAKVLLIHWAAKDGDAACRWAWQRFRAEGLWERAFREIGPSWASRQPKALEQWAIAHYSKSSGAISLRDGLASDEPILDFEMLGNVSRWLIHEDPRAAYTVLQARGGFSTSDKLAESLQTVDEVREALLAFDGLDRMMPNRMEGSDIHAFSLFARWQKLDPESLSRSPFSRFGSPISGDTNIASPPADLDSALAQVDTMPPQKRRGAFVRSFDSWTKAHPGQSPDQTDWSATRIQAWEDLEAIRLPDGK